MDNKDYYAAAKFYGVGCILLTLICLILFIMWCKKSPVSNEAYWAKKYDSLYVVSKQNELQWDTFHKKSKGYYFVNPTEKKGIKSFDLIKFTEEK